MKKRQIGIRLTDAQIAHFEALAEKEGCESIAEMFRKAAFSRWPMSKGVNSAPTVANCVPTVANSVPTQEEKKKVGWLVTRARVRVWKKFLLLMPLPNLTTLQLSALIFESRLR